MNESDYQRAKAVALSCVKNWIPDGRQEGSEWNAINPTRPDEKLGAFKINLSSGRWMDGSDGAKGNDCISLYVYLNNDRLRNVASNKKYKNLFGGMMAEAAQEIMLNHDPSYFPDSNHFEPKESTGDFWQGYSIVEKGIDHAPPIDLEWHEKMWGKHEKKWEFIKNKKTVLIVVRFRDPDGKKNDRPFTLWSNGVDYKWRAKGLPVNILYNVDELSEFPNRKVILTEGQKTGEIVKNIIGSEFISVAWYGGSNATAKTDWTPLAGREVYFSFDADIAGRNALIALKDIAQETPFRLIPVYPPADVLKKWDLADAIEKEGWTKQQVIDHILNNEETDEDKFLDDIGAYSFKILGYQGTDIVFYSHESHKIFKHAAASITKGILMALMDRKQFGILYKKDEGGIAWETAINDVLRRAGNTDDFDPKKIRTSGVWIDKGRIVIHGGNSVFIDGKEIELEKVDSDNVYIKGRKIPYFNQTPLTKEDTVKITDILSYINLTEKNQYNFLAGWILLAPFCGMLKWRSHIFLNGDTGTGKSFIMTGIMHTMVGLKYGVCGFGSSTAAGPRTALNNSSLPFLVDEMEGDTPQKKELVQQHLSVLREASSGVESKFQILHGSQDGTGKQWNIMTMAFCAGMNAIFEHKADENRFTILTLKDPATIKDGPERFKMLQEKCELLTEPWVEAFHARTANMLPTVSKAVDIFCEQASAFLNNRRNGDQIGTLLAGSWMISHDTVPTAQEAMEYIKENKIDTIFTKLENKTGPDLLMDTILSAKIEVSDGNERSNISVGRACLFFYTASGFIEFGINGAFDFPGASIESVKRSLEMVGFKLSAYSGKPNLKIALDHSGLKKLLEKTSFSASYDGIIQRCKGFLSVSSGGARFDSINKRYYNFDPSIVFKREVEEDEIPF